MHVLYKLLSRFSLFFYQFLEQSKTEGMLLESFCGHRVPLILRLFSLPLLLPHCFLSARPITRRPFSCPKLLIGHFSRGLSWTQSERGSSPLSSDSSGGKSTHILYLSKSNNNASQKYSVRGFLRKSPVCGFLRKSAAFP